MLHLRRSEIHTWVQTSGFRCVVQYELEDELPRLWIIPSLPDLCERAASTMMSGTSDCIWVHEWFEIPPKSAAFWVRTVFNALIMLEVRNLKPYKAYSEDIRLHNVNAMHFVFRLYIYMLHKSVYGLCAIRRKPKD